MTNLSQPSGSVRLSDLGELLAGLPVLFGFRPDRSLIVISLDGGRDRLGFRLRADLPALSLGRDDADYLADVLHRNASTRVLVVACSADLAYPLVGRGGGVAVGRMCVRPDSRCGDVLDTQNRRGWVEGLPPSAWRPSDIDVFGDDDEEEAVELG